MNIYRSISSVNSKHASELDDDESSTNHRDKSTFSKNRSGIHTASRRRTKEQEHELNMIQSYSLKGSAERNLESDLVSSHVSAAEFLSGESGDSFDESDFN